MFQIYALIFHVLYVGQYHKKTYGYDTFFITIIFCMKIPIKVLHVSNTYFNPSSFH